MRPPSSAISGHWCPPNVRFTPESGQSNLLRAVQDHGLRRENDKAYAPSRMSTKGSSKPSTIWCALTGVTRSRRSCSSPERLLHLLAILQRAGCCPRNDESASKFTSNLV